MLGDCQARLYDTLGVLVDLVWLGQARDSCYHLLMVSFLPQAPLCNGSMVWSVDLKAGGVRSLGFRDVMVAGGLGFLSSIHAAGALQATFRARHAWTIRI